MLALPDPGLLGLVLFFSFYFSVLGCEKRGLDGINNSYYYYCTGKTSQGIQETSSTLLSSQAKQGRPA